MMSLKCAMNTDRVMSAECEMSARGPYERQSDTHIKRFTLFPAQRSGKGWCKMTAPY